MIHSNYFLEKCQQLKNLGCDFPIEPGVRLGRGFADYGYEEFYLLQNSKLVSIFTGQVSDWQPIQQKFFFVIPDQFALLNAISLKEIEIISLIYFEQRDWQVVINYQDQEFSLENSDLDLLFIEILIFAYQPK